VYESLKDQNFEIIAAAQDTGGAAAADKWYEAAKATYTSLIDTQHTISTAYQFINVPMGIWIDERGKVVRPAEPAWTRDNELKIGAKSIVTQGEPYIAALRDWVTLGERSSYVLTDEEFARRVKPRSDAEMEADASFKLAVWFHNAGRRELASKYFERAQKLNPDDWNYHRQDWSFTPDEAGKKWREKFDALDKPYYPPLEIKKPEPNKQ
jgi:hypothetical protein